MANVLPQCLGVDPDRHVFRVTLWLPSPEGSAGPWMPSVSRRNVFRGDLEQPFPCPCRLTLTSVRTHCGFGGFPPRCRSRLPHVTGLAVLLGSGGCRVTWHTGDLGRDPPGTRFLGEQQEGLSSSQVVPSVPSLSPQEARRIPASPRGLQGGTVLYTCPWLKRGPWIRSQLGPHLTGQPHSQAQGSALRGRRASVPGQNPGTADLSVRSVRALIRSVHIPAWKRGNTVRSDPRGGRASDTGALHAA